MIDFEQVPLPDTGDPDLAPYWEATRRRELAVRHCAGCDRHLWPPRAACPHCGGLELDWRTVPSRGRLFTWTVVGHTTIAGFKAALPFAVGVIEIDGAPGVRMVGRLTAAPETLAAGTALRATFVEVDESVTLPVWEPA